MGKKRRADDDVPIREYVEAMFAEKEKALQAALASQEKAVQAALSAADKATSKAEQNAEKWRENANEWRGAMSDRDRELPSRREVEVNFAGLVERVSRLEARSERDAGTQTAVKDTRAQQSITIGQAIAAIGVAVAVLAIVAVVAIAMLTGP
jgi:hypothetical protein